ncbi:hypothetical protein ACNJYD_01635 [Bradyrhizobium sp. DASA03005]|uniref:hypothetical protein n=1 Tax=Bradyrhizobium sp. SPXBL-02 TaxID=3395912 RepID=UPI003F7241FB
MFRICLTALSLFGLVSVAAAQPAPPSVAPTTRPAKGATPKGTPNPKQAGAADAGPCEIGLLAAAANRFGVQQVGFTMFGNEYTPVPVDSWGLDDLILSRLRAAAAGKSVRRIAYSPAAFAHAVESGSPMLRRNPERQEFVQQSAATTKCQRYVLVERYQNRFSNTNQSVEGFGIVKWGNPIKRRTFLYALTYITVYDGQSFEAIKKGPASLDDEPMMSRLIGINPISGPNKEMDEAAFPSAPAEVAANAKLRDGVRALLTTSLDRTLPGLLQQ